jgi:hypothetical protein
MTSERSGASQGNDAGKPGPHEAHRDPQVDEREAGTQGEQAVDRPESKGGR